MSILNKIIANKKKEVELKKKLFPTNYLEKSPLFDRKTFSLTKKLKSSKSGIIAEHKRRSPSKSVINNSLTVTEVVKGYQAAGVCGISVLTDLKYFGGSIEDLNAARAESELPLLRKEFFIDTYQLIEAKAHGADVILLIAAILNRNEIKLLSETAKDLNLEVLLEVHNDKELKKSIMPSLDLIGVNNRNLKTFEIDLETSKSLAAKIPDNFVKVSESGISNVDLIKDLKTFGFQGFLIGENFMRSTDPGRFCSKFYKKTKLMKLKVCGMRSSENILNLLK